jgi:hypothetical protein
MMVGWAYKIRIKMAQDCPLTEFWPILAVNELQSKSNEYIFGLILEIPYVVELEDMRKFKEIFIENVHATELVFICNSAYIAAVCFLQVPTVYILELLPTISSQFYEIKDLYTTTTLAQFTVSTMSMALDFLRKILTEKNSLACLSFFDITFDCTYDCIPTITELVRRNSTLKFLEFKTCNIPSCYRIVEGLDQNTSLTTLRLVGIVIPL